MKFDQLVESFLRACHMYAVKMIMVGGAAVNFHGYQRHSADVDFWIDTTDENLAALKKAIMEIGYEFSEFPEQVKSQEQNISIKVSPIQEIELITRFNPGVSFENAFQNAELVKLSDEDLSFYRVLNIDHLLESKRRSGRPKDLLDIQELRRIHNT